MAKFNEQICEEIIIAHENGLPQKACAGMVGIDRKTLYNWLQKGKKAKSGKFRDFYLRWLKAEARFQAYHLKKINDSKSWVASQYLLQVTDPDAYVVAEKKEVDAKIESDNEVKIENKSVFDEITELDKELEEYYDNTGKDTDSETEQ